LDKSFAALLKENLPNAFHKVLWLSMQGCSEVIKYKVNWKVVNELKLNQIILQKERLNLYN